MRRRPKKSKKRSDASSIAAKRLDSATFYLDECIYSRELLNQLRSVGATVEHVGQAFPFGTEDQVWLSECGRRGWIILTRDKAIRRRRLEIDSIREHGAAAFCLIATDTTA